MEDNSFERIHFLNGYKMKKNQIFTKYIPYEYFCGNIRDKNLVFVSPNTWVDPFEQFYYEAEIYEQYDFKMPAVFCLCVTDSTNKSEAAFWNAYGKDKKAIRINFYAGELLKQINEYCIKENYDLYIGKMLYDYDENTIRNLKNPKNEYHNQFFKQNMKIEDFLALLTLKRNSFEYEREIRFFLVSRESKTSITEDMIHVSDINYTDVLISSLTISPLYPLSYKDSRKKEYKKLNTQDGDKIKAEIKSLLPELSSKKLMLCHLYEKEEVKSKNS